jgi:excisionase family DNA binding protein
MTQENILSDYVTEKELARQLGRDVFTLKRWRREGRGPAVTTIGRSIYFRAEAVREWLASQEKRMPRETPSRRSAGGRRATV